MNPVFPALEREHTPWKWGRISEAEALGCTGGGILESPFSAPACLNQVFL